MKKIIFIMTSVATLLFSCNKTPGGCDPGMMQQMLKLHYFDNAGNDLFTDGKNGFVKDSVKVYDFNNGVQHL